jgi:hypothetical protein
MPLIPVRTKGNRAIETDKDRVHRKVVCPTRRFLSSFLTGEVGGEGTRELLSTPETLSPRPSSPQQN